MHASNMKRFSKHEEPWGGVDVKHWPEVRDPQRYARKELFIGSVTDPYQPPRGGVQRIANIRHCFITQLGDRVHSSDRHHDAMHLSDALMQRRRRSLGT